MSYDVHIRVIHHPKHADAEDEHVEVTGFKMVDPTGDPLHVVADCLRMFADELDAKAHTETGRRTAEADRDRARAEWLERRGKSR